MVIEERLTERQKEVFELLISGKPTKVIAANLGIAESTVKSHVHYIYRIYRVSSRYELMALFFNSKAHF